MNTDLLEMRTSVILCFLVYICDTAIILNANDLASNLTITFAFKNMTENRHTESN